METVVPKEIPETGKNTCWKCKKDIGKAPKEIGIQTSEGMLCVPCTRKLLHVGSISFH